MNKILLLILLFAACQTEEPIRLKNLFFPNSWNLKELEVTNANAENSEICDGTIEIRNERSIFSDKNSLVIEYLKRASSSCYFNELQKINPVNYIDIKIISKEEIANNALDLTSKFINLKYLVLEGTFSNLGKLKTLPIEYLIINNIDGKSLDLKYVCAMKKLKYLTLYQGIGSNYDYKKLKDCIYLKGIEINANIESEVRFTDDDLNVVLSIYGLELLDVSRTQVTVHGILKALEVKTLKKIFACNISHSKKLTELPYVYKDKLYYWGECRCSSFIHFSESKYAQWGKNLKPVLDLRTSDDFYYLSKSGDGCKYPGLP